MNGFGVLLGKELREQWRTMRLPSALAIFAFIGIGSPLLARYTPQIVSALGGEQFKGIIPSPTIADAYLQFAKNAGQLGAALVIILAMGSVSVERDRGTLAFLLSKPVSRATVLLAKLVALDLTIAASVGLGAVLTAIYTAVLFGPPSPRFVPAALVALLALLVFTAATFAASTATRSTVAAAGIGFALLVGLGALSAIHGLGDYTPNGAMAKAFGAITTGPGPSALQVGILGGAIVAAFLVALGFLRRQEL